MARPSWEFVSLAGTQLTLREAAKKIESDLSSFFLFPSINMKYDGQLTLFDVTVWPKHNKYLCYKELFEPLSSIAKKFVFQQERAHDGDDCHWQVRLSLQKPKRDTELLSQIIPQFPGHWSVTSGTVHKSARQFNYVMKVDTRVEGPWTEKDTPPDPALRTVMVSTIFAHFEANTLYAYQKYVYEQSNIYDCRVIDVFYDTEGNTGKSSFCEWMEYMGRAVEVPPFRDMQDLVAFCMDQPTAKAYLIDMPRGMKKDKLAEFYAGIETLKNGYLYDKRFKGRKRRIERPRLFLFTNTLPVLSLLSQDRWRIWNCSDKSKLVQWEQIVNDVSDCE